MLGDISEEIRTVYRSYRKWGVGYQPQATMADALRDVCAAKLKTECGDRSERCPVCKAKYSCLHNNWTDEQWQAEADRILKGE